MSKLNPFRWFKRKKDYEAKLSEMETILISVITTHEDFLELLSYKYNIDIIKEWTRFIDERGLEL